MKMMSFSKKDTKASSGSNDVLFEVSLSKYGVDLKNVTSAEITNLCKMRE